MKKIFLWAVVPFLLAGACMQAWAQDGYREQMKGLDEQVQEVKSDALSIAAELSQLEEKLLYPSDTHFAIFVQLAKGDTLRLDSVDLRSMASRRRTTSTASRSSKPCRREGCSACTPATSPAGNTSSK